MSWGWALWPSRADQPSKWAMLSPKADQPSKAQIAHSWLLVRPPTLSYRGGGRLQRAVAIAQSWDSLEETLASHSPAALRAGLAQSFVSSLFSVVPTFDDPSRTDQPSISSEIRDSRFAPIPSPTSSRKFSGHVSRSIHPSPLFQKKNFRIISQCLSANRESRIPNSIEN